MSKKKPTKKSAFSHMLNALQNIAARFPIEFKTTLDPRNCECNQFLDHEDCRHILVLEAIYMAEDARS